MTEVAVPSAINYYVKLEGLNFWKTVRIDGEGIASIVEKYQKMP